MNKHKEDIINSLIQKVIQNYSHLESDRLPIKDGITNQNLYEKAPIKICFILKEAYDILGNKEIGNGGWDHAEYLNHYGVYQEIETHKRVSYFATGIFKNYLWGDSEWEKIKEEEYDKDFRSVAWINIGKFPAPEGKITEYSRLKLCYKQWKEVLFMQMEQINPDIFFFGNTFSVMENDLKSKLTYMGEVYPSKFYKDEQNRLYIDTYHPGMMGRPVSVSNYFDSVIHGIRRYDFRKKSKLYSKDK